MNGPFLGMTTQEVVITANLVLGALVVLMGLIVVPKVKNLITDKLQEFEARFTDFEKEAHTTITTAIGEIKAEQKAHRADQDAHSNLSRFARIEAKLNDVHIAIQKAFEESRTEFQTHIANQHAHPNLVAVAKLEPKLEDVRVELARLAVVVETLRTSWTRPSNRRTKKT